ncbi:Phage tail assembly chaperone protein, E, or 41 or 14 [Vibrio xiamenensis]|uniref:Phage tail assembly chaperone protein, E, or 41 or 14 n=1 Tax=Vibrio xiamenensis TaxID=861298 RepID=A0A1G8HWP5_9VIBR|nr:phage tail assembly protein [Vibrio xiamenensis]SDI11078.1 Phage tail assembly chaperone protein, E, or 41 or 14 [Vibrio xiamenensis]
MSQTFGPITHDLLHPIQDGEKEILSLTFEPLRFEQYSQVDVSADDPDPAIEELVCIVTGLSQKAFDTLSLPDYNSIERIIYRMTTMTSQQWKKDLKHSHETISLLLPLRKDDGQSVGEIELKVPSVKTRKIYKAIDTDKSKQEFITHACTGLSVQEVGRLFMPDWNQLQAHINDFLNKQADYFQSEM